MSKFNIKSKYKIGDYVKFTDDMIDLVAVITKVEWDFLRSREIFYFNPIKSKVAGTDNEIGMHERRFDNNSPMYHQAIKISKSEALIEAL